MVQVTLNNFDDEGNVVDSDTMDLTEDQISDIIDHAAQFIILKRDGKLVQSVLNELEDALVVAGVIDEQL